MSRSRYVYASTALLAALLLAACGDPGDPGMPDPSDPPADPGPSDPPPPALVQPASTKARLQRKGPALLANDLARALALPRAELCRELGTYDCFDTHSILLGGVEPYRLGVDEPITVPSVAAPMAVDRIALSACGERAARDLDDPDSAEIYVALDPAAPTTEALSGAAGRLYERLLARPAEVAEIDALVDLYAELEPSPEPARTWAQLACYAVATSTEHLFY
ncbi:hypothetical protein [Haliangium sp.]|uniref:hypothetical protein n=1 Tax=Haliangium sp. TaxID=2663208 RepID=UPI003D0E74BD